MPAIRLGLADGRLFNRVKPAAPPGRGSRGPRAKIGLAGARRRSSKPARGDKLTARERIALLIDEGTFVELGIHGRPHFSQRAMDGVDAPADGVITGYGKLDGRLAAVARMTSR